MKDTFSSPKILRNLDDLKTHNKTYEILAALCDKIQVAVHNNNMELANKLVEKTFVKLEQMNIKRPISANEFKGYLNNKSKILKFTKEISTIAGKLAEITKYEGLITKTFAAVKGLNDLYNARKKITFAEKVGKLKKDREKFKDAYKKMKVIMEVADVVGEFAPTGMSEYIEFNVKFFKHAEQTVDLVDSYAENIIKKNKGIDSLNEVINGKVKNEYGSYTSASYSKMSKKQVDDF